MPILHLGQVFEWFLEIGGSKRIASRSLLARGNAVDFVAVERNP